MDKGEKFYVVIYGVILTRYYRLKALILTTVPVKPRPCSTRLTLLLQSCSIAHLPGYLQTAWHNNRTDTYRIQTPTHPNSTMECLLRAPMGITLPDCPYPKVHKVITLPLLLEVNNNGLVGQGTCLPPMWRDIFLVGFTPPAVLVRLAFSYTPRGLDTTRPPLPNTPLIMTPWLNKVTLRTTTPFPHLRFNLLMVCPST